MAQKKILNLIMWILNQKNTLYRKVLLNILLGINLYLNLTNVNYFVKFIIGKKLFLTWAGKQISFNTNVLNVLKLFYVNQEMLMVN